MNQWVTLAAFPSITMEFMNDWLERAHTNRVYVLDRAVLGDRAAAMHGVNFLKTQRTAANPFALPGSVHWWQPIRNNVVGFAGLKEDAWRGDGEKRPVITYVSRQDWGRRMLVQEDHEKLVSELYRLRDTYGYEVNVVSMDKLTRAEQFRLAGRTTVRGLLLISHSTPNPTYRS